MFIMTYIYNIKQIPLTRNANNINSSAIHFYLSPWMYILMKILFHFEELIIMFAKGCTMSLKIPYIILKKNIIIYDKYLPDNEVNKVLTLLGISTEKDFDI